jgi:hypothetical protein
MPWSVLATLAGVAVTALLGALAIVREESVVRQLERITALLKETPDDAEGRAHLEWLRKDLSRRLNYQYRAPRQRLTLFMGWFGLLFGIGNLLAIYFLAAFKFATLTTTFLDPGWEPWIVYGTLALMSVGLARSAYRAIGRRARRRVRWILRHNSDASKSPYI